jgi:hypothetical protein
MDTLQLQSCKQTVFKNGQTPVHSGCNLLLRAHRQRKKETRGTANCTASWAHAIRPEHIFAMKKHGAIQKRNKKCFCILSKNNLLLNSQMELYAEEGSSEKDLACLRVTSGGRTKHKVLRVL